MSRVLDVVAPPRMGTAFRWNLASSWVAQLGDGIALAAGLLLVASQTRSPTLIAAAAIVQRLPTLVLGLRWIRGHAPIRTLVLVILIFNITWGAPWGVLVYWAQERLGVGDVGFGLLTTASAVGGIAAVLGYGRLESRVPLAVLMKVCLGLEVLTHLALALTTVPAVAMVVMVVFGGYAFVWGSLSSAVRQRATPDRYQGRVGSVYWLGTVVGLLVGQFLGGLIAERFGPASPFWFAFAGSGLTLLLVWRQLEHIAHADEQATAG